ncbi:DUF2380 domain-containing protein [Chelatococcus sp. GCM10030263]|uniref:DUF2380 domain-containing protein n=1 Tax=Chelatococcus sp. GCM10030263 TaxID=3273387 RepID=UPI0036238489
MLLLRRAALRIAARASLRPLLALACAGLLLTSFGSFQSFAASQQAVVSVAIADFDNDDTAGEDSTRTTEHAARVDAFAGLLRDRLTAQGKYKIVSLTCPASPCSAGKVSADDLLQAARQAGARILIYGGVHKTSTLVQWALMQAVDLQQGKLILDRRFSFRGDTDEAFRRAAAFMAGYMDDVKVASNP